MPIWQLCANLLIPNCLRSNLSYSPLAALELYVNVAKPLLLLSIMELIGDSMQSNRFEIQSIKEKYEELQKQYAATTPYQYPLYFLENEDFFHLKWKKTRIKTHTPSAKLIRENIEYAFLDNALWNLLQEQQMREDFHTLVINNFLK